ncbi:unnamed protein product [Soboliphyme baturini]|uniref:ClpX-type ZB domain-containing protein n=1 Tax=Soboliphyme baturini TaxID=241478 RepID=A0A183IUN3_9BILA|nr:unnamed protein product [Soboliphyme baturini]
MGRVRLFARLLRKAYIFRELRCFSAYNRQSILYISEEQCRSSLTLTRSVGEQLTVRHVRGLSSGSGAGKDGRGPSDTGEKGCNTSDGDGGLSSGGGSGRGSGRGGSDGEDGGDSYVLKCPKCGDPCTHVETFVSSTRFVKCERCHHFFVVLSETDTRKSGVVAKTQLKTLPSPKKIYEYLDKYVVGQQLAKKILSVAIYNHYKRISHNPKPSTVQKADPVVSDSPRAYNSVTSRDVFFAGIPGFPNSIGSSIGGGGPGADGAPNSVPKKNITDVVNSDSDELKLDKSNLLLLGPTGCGTYLFCGLNLKLDFA